MKKIYIDCRHADHSVDWYYYEPICKKTGKLCYANVTECKLQESKNALDQIVEIQDCIPKK